MYPENIDGIAMYELADDFFRLDTSANGGWTVVKGTGGTLAVDASPGGWISVPSAASNNDYQFLASTATPFKLVPKLPIYFIARFSLAEAATNAANFVFGLSSVSDATLLGNDGAGPPASYSGALLYKVDGATSLQFETSNGGSQVASPSLVGFVSGRTYRAGFGLNPIDGAKAIANAWVYDETSGVLTNLPGQQLSMDGLAAMKAVFGVKAGSASAETLKVDFVRCCQAR